MVVPVHAPVQPSQLDRQPSAAKAALQQTACKGSSTSVSRISHCLAGEPSIVIHQHVYSITAGMRQRKPASTACAAQEQDSAAELLLATEELLRKLNSNKAAPLPPEGYLSDEDTGGESLRMSSRSCTYVSAEPRCQYELQSAATSLPSSSGKLRFCCG